MHNQWQTMLILDVEHNKEEYAFNIFYKFAHFDWYLACKQALEDTNFLKSPSGDALWQTFIELPIFNCPWPMKKIDTTYPRQILMPFTYFSYIVLWQAYQSYVCGIFESMGIGLEEIFCEFI